MMYHVWKGTPNLLILSPAFRESDCHKPQFFCLCEGNRGHFGPAMNLDPDFVAEALQYMMNLVKTVLAGMHQK